MDIRRGERRDLQVLIDFSIMLAFETENKQLDLATVTKGVTHAIDHPNKGIYYVAEIGGEIAGCLMITLQWVDYENKYVHYIQSVYTKKEFRGRGVFKALYHHVLEVASTQAIALRLYADSTNESAIEVYQRLGMTIAPCKFFEVDFAFN